MKNVDVRVNPAGRESAVHVLNAVGLVGQITDVIRFPITAAAPLKAPGVKEH